jgi:tripartite-type tricarboxylate transporter receptor subunit TctC
MAAFTVPAARYATRIDADLKALLSDLETTKRMHDRFLESSLDMPEHFRTMVLDDPDRFGPIAKRLDLRLD